MTFADLIAPMSEDTFFAEHYGKHPLHIASSRPKSALAPLLDRAGVERLLDHPTHWTPQRLKLVYNTQPIPPQEYCRPVDGVWRADRDRVRAFVSQGASLVADTVQDISADLARVGSVLSQRLGGLAGANIYVSRAGVQGFGPHYDLTEVFAFHCEGEKTWRIYENRVDAPIAFPQGDEPSVRAFFAQNAGRVAQEVRMRPGDVLYIPRGQYHDALAETDSLHVTFSILPHTGKILLRLLEEMALEETAFRQYMPEGEALQARLGELSARLADIAKSPAMRDAIAKRQLALRK